MNNSRRSRRPYWRSRRGKKGKTERRTPARPECEFVKAKQRFREQEKLAAIQFYGCGSKKGPLFDTYAHHSVATEPDQAPGKCRGHRWAIGVTSQALLFSGRPEIQNANEQNGAWP